MSILSGLALSALPMMLAQPSAADLPAPTKDYAERVMTACSEDGSPRDAALIDARAMRSADALSAAIENAGAQSVIILGGEFSGQDMRPVAPLLSGACLVDVDMSETDWSGTRLARTSFVRVSFDQASVVEARWSDIQLIGSPARRTDFSRARLHNLRFISAYGGADLTETNFAGSDLTGAVFACGITVDVWCLGTPDLRSANLTRADVSSLGIWDDTRTVAAKLDRTIIAPRSLKYLAEADITGLITLASYFTSPYGEGQNPPSVQISAQETRELIAATRHASAEIDSDDASFDCAKAVSTVETMICDTYAHGLRYLDRELARIWTRVRTNGGTSLRDQRRWLRSRSECGDQACLEARYEQRIAELLAKMGPGIVLAPDQSITYHSNIVPLPEPMRRGELYERILPVLIDASWQSVTLTGMEDGSITAEGDAVGGNAHVCGMTIPDARFDAETGWWSVDHPASGKRVPLFRVDGRKLVVRYSGNMGDTPVEAQEYVTCGARAGFDEGIDLTPAE